MILTSFQSKSSHEDCQKMSVLWMSPLRIFLHSTTIQLAERDLRHTLKYFRDSELPTLWNFLCSCNGIEKNTIQYLNHSGIKKSKIFVCCGCMEPKFSMLSILHSSLMVKMKLPKTYLSHGGSCVKNAMTFSSRNGNLGCRPWSLVTRLSRPKFLREIFQTSVKSSLLRASQPERSKVFLCLVYPPSNSSAPIPRMRTYNIIKRKRC